jgi:hypothetical protein
MSLTGRAADLGPPVQIGHAAAQDTPLGAALWIVFRSAPDPEVFGFIDRILVAQHGA